MDKNEVRAILRRVTIGHRPFGILVEEDQQGVYIYGWYREADVTNGVMAEQVTRKWRIEPHWTETEVVKTVYSLVTVSDEHQRREHFRLDGYAIFSPHIPVNLLKRGAREHYGEAEPAQVLREEVPLA